MSNPADIRAAVKATLKNSLGTTWSVSSYWRANPQPPQLDMMFGQVDYDTAMMAGNQHVPLTIRATVQGGDNDSAQAALDPLIDWSGTATSLKAILEADRTLGGTISAIRVSDVSELKLYPTEGGFLPGVEFQVEVTPNG